MKKPDLRSLLVGGAVAVGSGLVSYGLFNHCGRIPDFEQNPPARVYHINADGENYSGIEHDDLVVGYENGDSEVLLRDVGGKLHNVGSFKSGELNRAEVKRKKGFDKKNEDYDSELNTIKTNFAGIREQLK